MEDLRLIRCLEPGMSVMVGSVNPHGDPSTCRALALVSDDHLLTAVVYLPLATSADTTANVRSTRRLAVVATNPLDNFSVQVKGTAECVRPARADEEAIARRGFDGFA